MNIRIAAVLLGFAATSPPASAAETLPARPKSGKAEIMPVSEVKQGMKGTAWTVFQGTEPEAVPVEIIGICEKHVGSEAGHHHRQDGRQGAAHQRRQRE